MEFSACNITKISNSHAFFRSYPTCFVLQVVYLESASDYTVLEGEKKLNYVCVEKSFVDTIFHKIPQSPNSCIHIKCGGYISCKPTHLSEPMHMHANALATCSCLLRLVAMYHKGMPYSTVMVWTFPRRLNMKLGL